LKASYRTLDAQQGEQGTCDGQKWTDFLTGYVLRSSRWNLSGVVPTIRLKNFTNFVSFTELEVLDLTFDE